MADRETFSELQKCLEQASRLCSRLSSDDQIPSSTISVVAAAANNARSMINCSTSSGLYKRLEKCERLRASSLPGSGSGKKTSKQGNKKRELEVKAFEFVLVDAEDEDDFSMTTVISDETVLLRGFVQIRSDATENDIREISEAIQIKYPLVTATDIEFLKANRKKRMKPVNSSEYNFKQIKLLAGQGAIYVKVKNGYDCLLKSNEEEGRDKKK